MGIKTGSFGESEMSVSELVFDLGDETIVDFDEDAGTTFEEISPRESGAGPACDGGQCDGSFRNESAGMFFAASRLQLFYEVGEDGVGTSQVDVYAI